MLTTCWFKKRKIRWLVFQSWRQSTDQGLVLLWASVRSSSVPAFLLFILASSFPSASDLSPAVLHWSLLTQNTSLGQGQTTSLLSYSWYWDLPLFSIAHTEKCAILLSRKVAKRNKKTNVLKGIEMQPLWLLYFPLLFSHHHRLQLQQEQWDKSCPVSQSVQFSSVAQWCLTLCNPMNQHARPPYPTPAPGVYSNSCPLSWWCHPAISSFVAPLSSCLQSFPASESFQSPLVFLPSIFPSIRVFSN